MADEGLGPKVAAGFEAAGGLLIEVLRQNREESALLGAISGRLDVLQKTVDRLAEHVELGNGQPSLMAQVQTLRHDIEELKRRPAAGAVPESVLLEGVKGKYQVILLLLGSLFGSSGLILGILNWLKSH